MKVWLTYLFTLSFVGLLWGQQPERKLVIDNDTYYFVTVNDNYQLATLYTGNINVPIKEAKRYQLPVGRNLTAQFNPLAWDLKNDSLVAVNFMDHVLNDRFESIKKIGLTNLTPMQANSDLGQWMDQAVEWPSYVFNQPYLFVKQQSDFLNHFYFDLAFIDQSMWLVMSNNDQFVVWEYDDDGWKHSKVFEKKFTSYFTLMEQDQKPILVLSNGELISLSLENVKVEQAPVAGFELKDYTLVIDKNKGKVYSLKTILINENSRVVDLLIKGEALF